MISEVHTFFKLTPVLAVLPLRFPSSVLLLPSTSTTSPSKDKALVDKRGFKRTSLISLAIVFIFSSKFPQISIAVQRSANVTPVEMVVMTKEGDPVEFLDDIEYICKIISEIAYNNLVFITKEGFIS